MTHAIGPDGQPRQAPQLTPRAAGTPRPAVSILSDLSPGRVRLSPTIAPRPARWKWALPPVLLALVGGGFLLGRQAPGPTPPAPGPAAPLADARPAPPGVAEPPLMPAAPGGAGGGAIIREPSPPPSSPGTPEATPRAAESVAAPPSPPALPRPSPARSVAPSPAKPSGEPPARHSAHQAPDRPAAPPPGQAAPGRAAERDVDIITAIVK
mgnify:CR=1 FL=1